jgi:hypothetical protein
MEGYDTLWYYIYVENNLRSHSYTKQRKKLESVSARGVVEEVRMCEMGR